MLEGSVRRAADRIRIIAQLIDSTTGAHIWADRIDGTLRNVFDLQDEVTASIVGAIGPRLERAEIERSSRKPTASLDAYDYYLRAVANYYPATSVASDEMLRLLYRAIELDPGFAAAYGITAWCYCWRASKGWTADRSHEMGETARLARRAVELGRDDAMALAWAGFSLANLLGELDDGAAFLDRALALNPNLAIAWGGSGWVRVWLGEPQIAIEHVARAIRLSPFDPIMPGFQSAISCAHFFAGDYDEASLWAEKVVREYPDFPGALTQLAVSNALAGRPEVARKAMGRLLESFPTRRAASVKEWSLTARLLRRPEDGARLAEGLLKAGMPE